MGGRVQGWRNGWKDDILTFPFGAPAYLGRVGWWLNKEVWIFESIADI